jgi:hypothetical protein
MNDKAFEPYAILAIGLFCAGFVFYLIILPTYNELIASPNSEDCRSLCGQNGMRFNGYYIDDNSVRDGYCRCIPMKYDENNPDFTDRWIRWDSR